MALKKKLTGLSKLLLLLPFMLLFVGSFTTSRAQDQYTLSSENLKRIYGFAKQQSIDLYPQTLVNDYNLVLDKWALLDAYSGDIDWANIATQLNLYLYNTWSGDTHTDYFNNDNLMVFFVPSYSTETCYNFVFVPYIWRVIKIVESTNRTSSGETYFTHDMYLNDSSGAGVPYLRSAVYLKITLSGDWYLYNDMQNFLNNLQNSFYNNFKTKYSYYIDDLWTYAYGIVGLFDNETSLAGRRHMIFYRPPGTSGNIYYYNYYNMNIDTNYISTSGDYDPTPTPEPTGSGGDSVDLTETNDLISNVENTVNSLVSAVTEDFNISGELITSGEIIDSIGVPKFNNPHTNVWLHLTNGLYDALLGVNREIEFDLFNETHTINLDDIGWEYPLRVQTMLQTISTCCMVWILIRYWHKITDKLQSGDIDSILLESSEEGIVNLF